MSYCCFSSLMKIMKDNIKAYNYENESDFLENYIFVTFNKRFGGISKNFSTVSRWFSGDNPLSKEIGQFYNENKVCLYDDMKVYADNSADFYKAVEEIKELVSDDTVMSLGQKNELLSFYDNISKERLIKFVAEVLYYAMGQVPQNVNVKSIPTQNIILGCKPHNPCKAFVGRNTEIETLHNMLSENNSVFVEGIGGIGKSELVKKYAYIYKNDYTNIISLKYNGSLKDLIADIEFADDEKYPDEHRNDKYRRHYSFLKKLGDDTLIIIDNFDTTIEQETLIEEFLQNNFKVLLTTRHKFEDYPTLMLDEMDIEALLNLINEFYAVTDDNKAILISIINVVHNHTFLTELCARLLKNGFISPSDLLASLEENNVNLDNEEKIQVKKDDKSVKTTYTKHIRKLFELFKLTDKQQYILKNICFVSPLGISTKTFCKWSEEQNGNDISDLMELGLIHNETGVLSLHSIIKDVIIEELKPTIAGCAVLVKNIKYECLHYGTDTAYYRNIIDFISNILSRIIDDDTDNYLDLAETAFCYAEKYNELTFMHKVINLLDHYIKNDLTDNARDKAQFYMFRAAYVIKKYENKFSSAVDFTQKAINIAEENNSEDLTAMLGILYSNLGEYLLYESPKTNIPQTIAAYNKAFGLMQQADTLHSYDGAVLVKRICEVYTLSGMEQQALKQLEYLQTIFKPDTIPQSYEEYIALCNRNENPTLLEYTDIVKTIAVIKASEDMNYNKEVKEIRNIYNVICKDNFTEIEQMLTSLKSLKKQNDKK